MPTFKNLACLLVLLTACGTHALAQAQDLPPELNQVLGHLLKKENYPESYKGVHYRVRVTGFALGDAASDGSRLAFLLINPHYHQTAPIQIYRIRANGEIQRINEALAPGPLIARDDQRLDAHTLGLGVDMGAAKGPKGEDRLPVLARSGAAKAHMVLYKHFVHMDLPDDVPGFVDVSDREEFADADKCEGFQFSQPGSIAAEGVQLAAMVGDEIDVYSIAHVGEDGLLDKTLVKFKRPDGAERLLRLPDGRIGLAFADGHSAALKP